MAKGASSLSYSWDPLSWIRNWEEKLKKPEEIVFWRTLRNISEYLSQELPTSKGPYEDHLLDILRLEFRRRSVELSLLKKSDIGVMRSLEHLLQQSNPPRPGLIKALGELVKVYQSDRFLDVMEQEFIECARRGTRQADNKIHTLSFLLTRHLLQNFSTEHLSALPSKSFVRTLFRVHEPEFRQAIKDEPKLLTEIPSVAQRVVETATRIAGNINLDEKFYDKFFHSPLRWTTYLEWRIMKLKAELATDTIGTKLSSQTKESFVENLLLDNATNVTIQEFRKYYLDLIADCLTDILLDFLAILTGRGPDLVHGRYSEKFTEVMQSILPRSDLINRSPYSAMVAGSLEGAIHSWYSGLLVSFLNRDLHELDKLIAKAIFGPLYDQTQINQSTPLPERVSDAIFSFEVRKSLLFQLRSLAREIIPAMISRLQEMHQSATVESNLSALHAAHIDKIFKRLDERPSDFLQDLSTDEKVEMVKDLFNAFRKKNRIWHVIHIIDDLDCDGKRFEIGGVVFFDARKWDYGEGTSFDAHTVGSEQGRQRSEYLKYDSTQEEKAIVEFRRNSARVMAKVEAGDYRAAIELARIKTWQALSALVFANSGHAGFNPSMPLWSHVADEKMLKVNLLGQSGDHGSKLKIDDSQRKIIDFYDKLMQWNNIQTKTALERALAWYLQARWEEVPHAKFVSYWISLERLIAQGGFKKSRLIDYVPRLVATWHNSDEGLSFWLSSRLRSSVQQIQSDQVLLGKITSEPQLSNFDMNHILILEHLEKFRKIAKGRPASRILSDIARFVRTKKKFIKAVVRERQEDYKLMVAMLNQKRNSLVHDSLSYSIELPSYNSVLEEIVRDTLIVLLEEHQLNLDLDQIARKQEQPFPL